VIHQKENTTDERKNLAPSFVFSEALHLARVDTHSEHTHTPRRPVIPANGYCSSLDS